jgi:hypothetical protein
MRAPRGGQPTTRRHLGIWHRSGIRLHKQTYSGPACPSGEGQRVFPRLGRRAARFVRSSTDGGQRRQQLIPQPTHGPRRIGASRGASSGRCSAPSRTTAASVVLEVSVTDRESEPMRNAAGLPDLRLQPNLSHPVWRAKRRDGRALIVRGEAVAGSSASTSRAHRSGSAARAAHDGERSALAISADALQSSRTPPLPDVFSARRPSGSAPTAS